MFGCCRGGPPSPPKPLCLYICKRCGEIVTMDEVVKHLYLEHNWNCGSFEDALDEYDRKIDFARKRRLCAN